MVKSMNLVRQWSDGKLNLIINNHVFPDIIMPNQGERMYVTTIICVIYMTPCLIKPPHTFLIM
jgi:hypothetical protein